MMSVAGPAGITNAPMNLSQQDQWKKAAAEAAAKLVESGMVVGLGTGSTAAFLVSALGRRAAEENLRITAIPTSEGTAAQARTLNIPLTTFADHTEIDLTIDGADEVLLGPLYLIKGHAGRCCAKKSSLRQASAWRSLRTKRKLLSGLARWCRFQWKLFPMAGRQPRRS